MEQQKVKNMVVIGAAAGGISAVSKLAATFTPELDAAIFVVIHLSDHLETQVVCDYVQQHTQFHCKIAANGEDIVSRTIYFAPADHHMVVVEGKVEVYKGHKSQQWRPSIDVLFRSAAVAYHTAVTGVILTGLTDDGVSGMATIKRQGGICMIQEPAEADFPFKPLHVQESVEVDYTVSLEEMTFILLDHYSLLSLCN
jgi:two-component system, chemotaxis family, protein-glutamate methylesterase/glutaminase